jgi:hypothetical protein
MVEGLEDMLKRMSGYHSEEDAMSLYYRRLHIILARSTCIQQCQQALASSSS